MTRVWLGPTHGCALLKAGQLACWGANDNGQLTSNSFLAESSTFPVYGAIPPPEEVAIGARHTCGLFGRNVRCWGDGSRLEQTRREPAIAITASGDMTCTVTPESAVHCFRAGLPEIVRAEGLSANVTHLAVGRAGICASLAAPTRLVRCAPWIALGSYPSAAWKELLQEAAIQGLTVGDKHACALLEGGSIRCWGDNAFGQLGDGTTEDRATAVTAGPLPPALEVRAGANHTCARLFNNTVACWGDNRAHQLASGTTAPSAVPLPLRGLVGVMELAAGGDGTCARLSDGAVRCWGPNHVGQLGDGTTNAHDVPMPVRSPRVSK